MSLGQIREILIRRDKDLSLSLYYAGGGKEIRAHVTGDLAQLGTNPPQSSVTSHPPGCIVELLLNYFAFFSTFHKLVKLSFLVHRVPRSLDVSD